MHQSTLSGPGFPAASTPHHLAAISCISRTDRPPGPRALLDSFDRDFVMSVEERALELPPSLFSRRAKAEVPPGEATPLSVGPIGCWEDETPGDI